MQAFSGMLLKQSSLPSRTDVHSGFEVDVHTLLEMTS